MSRCCSVTSGPHVAAARAVAGAQRRHALGDLGHEGVAHRADREDRRDRHAALPRRAEAGVDGGVRGEVEVGVRQDHHVVLRAAQGLDALAVPGAGLVHVARDRGGADERDRLDVGVLEQAVDGHLVAVHDVEDARRQARLGQRLGDQVGGRGVLLARLDDDGVAGGDRDREEPHRHHRREVERRDDPDHPEGLADRVDVDLGRDALGEAALLQVRDAAGELHDLQAAADLAERISQHLAVLRGDDRRELLLAGVQDLAEAEQHLRAAGQRGLPPLLPGGPGRGDGVVDVVGGREVDPAGHLAGGRVEDVAAARGDPAPGLAVDPVGHLLGRLLRDHLGHGSRSCPPGPPLATRTLRPDLRTPLQAVRSRSRAPGGRASAARGCGARTARRRAPPSAGSPRSPPSARARAGTASAWCAPW